MVKEEVDLELRRIGAGCDRGQLRDLRTGGRVVAATAELDCGPPGRVFVGDYSQCIALVNVEDVDLGAADAGDGEGYAAVRCGCVERDGWAPETGQVPCHLGELGACGVGFAG